jgi:ppGpp synthetase/RelA/SpoT-type nucleotidyltranferase
MAVIEDFINRYRKEYDFYDQAARLVAQSLDGALQSAGIRAIVTSRAKSPTRLEEKVRQRDSTKHYAAVDDIYLDIVDLAGARVALYFPAERDQVGKLIRDSFLLIADPKEFPGGSAPTYSKRFSGYWATHYRVRLRETALNEAQRRYADAPVEIQVASVLMHAWAEVEHDLVYKPLQGRLSDDEYAILDELNGLVMAGEIALERLQKAGEARVAAGGRRFANHYELAAYLLDRASSVLKGPAPDSALGRVDLLHALLDRLDRATPDRLERYLAAWSADIERRPLAEQIVDQLLAEDDTRYDLYEEIKVARDSAPWKEREREVGPEIHAAIGLFLSRWIQLEQLIREIVLRRTGEEITVLPTTRALQRLEVSNVSTRSELERIRRLRNNLVHGFEVPDAPTLLEASDRLTHVVAELRQALPGEDHTAA